MTRKPDTYGAWCPYCGFRGLSLPKDRLADATCGACNSLIWPLIAGPDPVWIPWTRVRHAERAKLVQVLGACDKRELTRFFQSMDSLDTVEFAVELDETLEPSTAEFVAKVLQDAAARVP